MAAPHGRANFSRTLPCPLIHDDPNPRNLPREPPRILTRIADLGPLPEWNLADLYPAIDAPEVRRDLERGDAECLAFENAYKGKLAELAGKGWRARSARR